MKRFIPSARGEVIPSDFHELSQGSLAFPATARTTFKFSGGAMTAVLQPVVRIWFLTAAIGKASIASFRERRFMGPDKELANRWYICVEEHIWRPRDHVCL